MIYLVDKSYPPFVQPGPGIQFPGYINNLKEQYMFDTILVGCFLALSPGLTVGSSDSFWTCVVNIERSTENIVDQRFD